jgi:hypothetical protein
MIAAALHLGLLVITRDHKVAASTIVTIWLFLVIEFFMSRSFQEQQSEIFSWLDDREEGLQKIIIVLKSPDILVRRVGYELLQMIHEEIAQDVVAPGFPLYPGEIIYQVYESAISYNDCHYDLLTCLNDFTVDNPTTLLSSYVDRTHAEAAAFRYHHLRAVEDLTLNHPYLFETTIDQHRTAYSDFPILEWCQQHEVPIRWPDEAHGKYAERFAAMTASCEPSAALNQFFLAELSHVEEADHWVMHQNFGQRAIAFLVAVQQNDLMAKLWLDVAAPLAFIHEHPIDQLTYCDFQKDDSTIVLKNHFRR